MLMEVGIKEQMLVSFLVSEGFLLNELVLEEEAKDGDMAKPRYSDQK